MGSPTVASLFAQRVVVGVGDMGVSNNPSIILSTYALGSCVAIAAYDPISKAGGILHLMLPDSKISPQKAIAQPAMFADTGLPLLFRALLGVRGEHDRLRLFVAGGACIMCNSDMFKIGARNLDATSAYLSKNGYHVWHSAAGGTINRTLHLELDTGKVTLKTPVGNENYSLAL